MLTLWFQEVDTKMSTKVTCKEPGHAGILANLHVKPRTEVTIANQLIRSSEKEGEYDDNRYTEGASAP